MLQAVFCLRNLLLKELICCNEAGNGFKGTLSCTWTWQSLGVLALLIEQHSTLVKLKVDGYIVPRLVGGGVRQFRISMDLSFWCWSAPPSNSSCCRGGWCLNGSEGMLFAQVLQSCSVSWPWLQWPWHLVASPHLSNDPLHVFAVEVESWKWSCAKETDVFAFEAVFYFSGNNWFNLGGIRAISAVLHGRVGIVSYAYISYIWGNWSWWIPMNEPHDYMNYEWVCQDIF